MRTGSSSLNNESDNEFRDCWLSRSGPGFTSQYARRCYVGALATVISSLIDSHRHLPNR